MQHNTTYTCHMSHAQLGLTDNLFYIVNGALLVVTFLLVRVMFVPLSITFYAGQYHQWDVVQALGAMRWVCHLANSLQFFFQLYWFVQLLRLARQVVRDLFLVAGSKEKVYGSRTVTSSPQNLHFKHN